MTAVILFMQWLEHYSIVLMMLVFIGIVVRTYWPSRKTNIERQGRIPFEDNV